MAKQDMRSCQLTYVDYLQFPDDGERHEIIDGDHFVTPAPRTRHQRASFRLTLAIGNFIEQRNLGLVFSAPFDVILSKESVVQPDLVFVSSARVDIVTEDNIQGAPDLVIEILSESTRKNDEVIKRELYERFGVKEYWLFDPEPEAAKIFRRTPQGFDSAVELSKAAGDVITTDLLPGFKLALSEIFE